MNGIQDMNENGRPHYSVVINANLTSGGGLIHNARFTFFSSKITPPQTLGHHAQIPPL